MNLKKEPIWLAALDSSGLELVSYVLEPASLTHAHVFANAQMHLKYVLVRHVLLIYIFSRLNPNTAIFSLVVTWVRVQNIVSLNQKACLCC